MHTDRFCRGARLVDLLVCPDSVDLFVYPNLVDLFVCPDSVVFANLCQCLPRLIDLVVYRNSVALSVATKILD